jgi:type I restriction enzyme S subunit
LLRTDSAIEPRFFYYWLQSAALHHLGYSRHYKLLAEQVVPFPKNREEQRRLVARIEALTSRLEQARQGRQAAVVEAEIIFTTVLCETFDRLDDYESIHKPALGTVATIRTGFAFKSADYRAKGRLVFRVSNIRADGTFNLEDSVYLAPELEPQYAQYQLRSEDILMVMVGATVGKLCFISDSVLPALMNQNMWRINPCDRHALLPRYLFYFLRATNLRELTLSESTHGHLKQGTYKEKPIPIPSPAEQRCIVARLNALAAKQTELRRLQTETEAELAAFTPALRAKAFRGEL